MKFSPKRYSAAIIAWNINFSLPHFLTIHPIQLSSNCKIKIFTWSLQESIPPRKWSHPFVVFPPYNFKISRKPICSTKSYKNGNYDRTTYKVSPYCCIPQANLITRLFTPPRLTLDHYRGEASLTQCYSEPIFQIQSPICGVNFSNNILMTQVRVNKERNWTWLDLWSH